MYRAAGTNGTAYRSHGASGCPFFARSKTMKPLRVGLIGAGTIAWSAHLPAITRLSPLIELVAIADVRLEVAQRAADRFGAEAAYDDYHQLLARPDIDFVDICTPEF